MAEAKDKAPVAKASEADVAEVTAKTVAAGTGLTHIRFIGAPTDDENSSTSVHGKVFFRGKWVPLTNLDGTNPDKTALTPVQMRKLVGSPAFQLGDGKDMPIPGVTEKADELGVEEA